MAEMEQMIIKIQREVDEANRLAELNKKPEKPQESFEFNKDELLKVDFPNLENAIKYLLHEVAILTKNLDSVSKDVKSRSYTVDKMFKESHDRDEKVKEAWAKIRDLENKSVDLENKSFEFNTNFESFKINSQIQARSVSGMQNRISELEDFQEQVEEKLKNINTSAPQTEGIANGDYVTMPDLQKLIDRMNSNDKLVDGFINKVRKMSDMMNDKNSKIKTPGFNEAENITYLKTDIEKRILNVEKDLEDIRSNAPGGNTAASNDALSKGTNISTKSHLRKLTWVLSEVLLF